MNSTDKGHTELPDERKADLKSLIEQVRELETQLSASDLPDVVVNSMLEQAWEAVGEASHHEIVQEMRRVLLADDFREDRERLAGFRLVIDVSFRANGAIREINDYLYAPTVSERNSLHLPTGASKRLTVYVNGRPYANHAEAARSHDIDIKGDSARRALEREQDAGKLRVYSTCSEIVR